jgi:hypothetical protein
MGHVVAPEPTSARRRGPELRNTWQRCSSTQQGGETLSHVTRGSTGSQLSKEVRSEAAGHVVASEPTSAGRCGPKLQLVWQHMDARLVRCLDLELVCGGIRSSECRQTPRPRSERWPWCTSSSRSRCGKKMSILKLEHFRREFGLPEDMARMLRRHPCLFYISNRYMIHTVVLREGYEGSELKVKDPVVMAKDMLGELMQEGLHEYNQRRRAMNLEKKRRD